MFLKNSQESSCARASFLITHSCFPVFTEHIFHGTVPGDCFCHLERFVGQQPKK